MPKPKKSVHKSQKVLPANKMRGVKSTRSQSVWLLAGLIAFNCVVGFWLYQYYAPRVLSFSGAPVDFGAIANPEQSFVAAPVTLVIPDAGINVAVTSGSIRKGIWETSPSSVLHLDISARPTQPGNIILYGHNWNSLLGKLKMAEVGQRVDIYTTDGAIHSYQIVDKTVVPPTDLAVIAPTREEVLTIYTCTGLFDSQRLVIKALPLPAGTL